jgi:hypothetical protein
MILTGTTASTSVKITTRALREATSSTYRQSVISIRFDRSFPVSWVVSTSAADELEWHAIVNNPQVRQKLRLLAAEARQQAAAGEIEEGGFAVE